MDPTTHRADKSPGAAILFHAEWRLFIRVPWLTPTCAVNHCDSYVHHDSLIWHQRDPTPHRADESMSHHNIKSDPHMCIMTYSNKCHGSLLCAPWLTHISHWADESPLPHSTCSRDYSYLCHDSLLCVPWLPHVCVMTLVQKVWRLRRRT